MWVGELFRSPLFFTLSLIVERIWCVFRQHNGNATANSFYLVLSYTVRDSAYVPHTHICTHKHTRGQEVTELKKLVMESVYGW